MAGKKQDLPEQYTHFWVEGLDGRTTLAKAAAARLTALEADLGGPGQLSYSQRSLCRRAIFTELVIEQSEAAFARGEAVEIGQLVQAQNSLLGLLRTLGLKRVAKRTPSLQEYISAKAAE
jgi:hypothetical protein